MLINPAGAETRWDQNRHPGRCSWRKFVDLRNLESIEISFHTYFQQITNGLCIALPRERNDDSRLRPGSLASLEARGAERRRRGTVMRSNILQTLDPDRLGG